MVTHFIMPWKNPKTGEVFDIYQALVDYYYAAWQKDVVSFEQAGEYWWNANIRCFLRKYGLPFNAVGKELLKKEFFSWGDFPTIKEQNGFKKKLKSWFEKSKWYLCEQASSVNNDDFQNFNDEFLHLKRMQTKGIIGGKFLFFNLLLSKPKYCSMQLTHYLELPLEKWIGPEFMGMKKGNPFTPCVDLLTSWNMRDERNNCWCFSSAEENEE